MHVPRLLDASRMANMMRTGRVLEAEARLGEFAAKRADDGAVRPPIDGERIDDEA